MQELSATNNKLWSKTVNRKFNFPNANIIMLFKTRLNSKTLVNSELNTIK